MEIVLICFRLIQSSTGPVYYISTAGWEVPLLRNIVPGSFPSPDCTEVSTVISVSWEWTHRLKQKLPIYLIIMDDAHRALFLDETASVEYYVKTQFTLFFSTDITCQGQIFKCQRWHRGYAMRYRRLEPASRIRRSPSGEGLSNWRGKFF